MLRRFFKRLRPREAYGVRGACSAPYTHLSVGLRRGEQRHNPVGVGDASRMRTRGSSFLATLGWRTQSRWDWNACNDVMKRTIQPSGNKVAATPEAYLKLHRVCDCRGSPYTPS